MSGMSVQKGDLFHHFAYGSFMFPCPAGKYMAFHRQALEEHLNTQKPRRGTGTGMWLWIGTYRNR